MKQDGMLIKLDKELKDKFKLYCSEKKTTMTRMIESLIIHELYNTKHENSTNDFYDDLNFYVREYQYLKNKISEMNRLTRALSARTERRSDSFYKKLLYRDFHSIEQFKDYQLLSTYDDIAEINYKSSSILEKLHHILQEYSSDFAKIPFSRGAAVAVDPISHKLIHIIFQPNPPFLHQELRKRTIDYDNLLTIFIVTSNEHRHYKETHFGDLSFHLDNKNASYIAYSLEEIFPVLHNDEIDEKYFGKRGFIYPTD